jgi:hypothetical protein
VGTAKDLYHRLPYDIRRTLVLDQARRWLLATAYAEWHNRRVGNGRETVNFFPMRPEPSMQIVSVLLRLRVRIGFSPQPGSMTMAWDTGTWFADGARRRLPPGAINGACLDISKSRVDRSWAEVSGYSITVDPLKTRGPFVVKPEQNGLHGGRVEIGPLKKRSKGVVYQRLVDSSEGDHIISTRAVIVGAEIPLAYETSRAVPNWFAGQYTSTPQRPEALYSADERVLLTRLAATLGLDYGEMDVLRDKESGRIYVVDANRTPVKQRLASREVLRSTYRDMAPAVGRLLTGRPPAD